VAELLTHNFEESPDTLVAVPVRLQDDLPAHIRGAAYWEPSDIGPGGPYRVQFENSDYPIPVEFINNDWYTITLENNRYQSSSEHRLGRGELGTGWWHEEDEQHPMNQRNQELMRPREVRPIDETTDEESSETGEDPPSPPPNYGRRSPTTKERREEELLVELTRL
jgi:hypothetical protein